MSPAMTNAVITLTSEVENLMGMLSDLLDRESEAVQSSDFETFRGMQNDKMALFSRYKSLMDTVQRQGSTLKSAGDPVTERLKKSIARFQSSAEKNAQTLEGGTKSMKRILERIVRATRETVHGSRQTYNKSGSVDSKSNGPLCIKVDEVL